jgi:Flp pilus assembly protein TadG
MIATVSVARRRRSGGNALVEFALAFPVLFMIFVGTFQFGYGFYIVNRLESTVRSAARYGAVREYSGSNGVPTSSYVTAVKNYAVTGDPMLSTPSLVPGLTTDNVQISVSTINGVPNKVEVAISGYTIDAVFKTFRLNGRPYASFRYSGRISGL